MIFSVLLPLLGVSTAVAAPVDYKLWCVGNCDKDVKTTTTPGVVLMGGGVNHPAFQKSIMLSKLRLFYILHRRTPMKAFNGKLTTQMVAISLSSERAETTRTIAGCTICPPLWAIS